MYIYCQSSVVLLISFGWLQVCIYFSDAGDSEGRVSGSRTSCRLCQKLWVSLLSLYKLLFCSWECVFENLAAMQIRDCMAVWFGKVVGGLNEEWPPKDVMNCPFMKAFSTSKMWAILLLCWPPRRTVWFFDFISVQPRAALSSALL